MSGTLFLNVKAVKPFYSMQYRNYFAFCMLFFLIFFGCTSKNDHSFNISGHVTNLKNNFIVFSKVEDIQKKETTVIDTLLVSDKGAFDAVYFLEPNIYTITFDNNKTIFLAIDKNQNIVISGNDIDNIYVNGSIDTQLLNEYEAFRIASLDSLVNSVRTHIKNLKKENDSDSEITTLRELEVENYKYHLNELIAFIKEKMGASIAIYPTSIRWNSENLPFLEALVTDFELANQSVEITQKLKERLRQLKKTNIGSVLSTIVMPNSSNELINLTDIKGKYTLIDFWASWCPPCRTESKLLNILYQTYNSEGFEIYGISLDSDKNRWEKALEKDNRFWTNVSTLEGLRTPVAQDYGINALPRNILINSNSEIIAVNIHGQKLKEKITGLFTD